MPVVADRGALPLPRGAILAAPAYLDTGRLDISPSAGHTACFMFIGGNCPARPYQSHPAAHSTRLSNERFEKKRMFLRRWMILPALCLGLAVLSGCGGSDDTNQAVAPPNGAFSNSALNGTYVVSFSGFDTSHNDGSFFALTGSLTANGSGGFTSGTVDISDPALGAWLGTTYVFNRLPTSGNYSITADGRGSGSISVTINGTEVQFGLDFVLTSNSHGLISRFDNNGTGSGTIDLQTSGLAQSALQGSYAFALNGVDSTIGNALATVGSFTLDSNGNITAGQQDFNDNGDSRNLQALALQGTVLVGSAQSAQLTTSAAGFGTLHFDVWAIDSTHLKLIETDSAAYLAGDALVATGQTAFPAGPLVFTLSGEDSQYGSFAAGGLLTSDGASLITGGVEDVNDQGYVAQAPGVSGRFTSNGVRTVLTLSGIYDGYVYNNDAATGDYVFAAYPYNGGVMLLEIDGGAGYTPGISSGNAYVQTATSLASSQGYGLNLSGLNDRGEVDLIAQFTTSNGTTSGLYDVNNLDWLISDFSLGSNATYSVGSNGRGTAQFPYLQTDANSLISELDLTFYVVDSSDVVFIETDGNQLATGVLQAQNAGGESGASPSRTMFAQPGFAAMSRHSAVPLSH
jgi:hypothetical protein